MISAKISNFFILFYLVGFPLVSLIPIFLGTTEITFSFEYRSVILLLASLIIFFSFFLKKTLFYGNFTILFLLFWFIYSIRLINDLFGSIDQIDIAKPRKEYLMFAFGVSFIPSIALLFINITKIQFGLILNWLYKVIFVFLLIALIYRSGADLYGRTTGNMVIGILFYGQYGASLSILSIYFLSKNLTKIESFFYSSGLLIGIITIFISSSRSPFLVLIIVSSLYLIIQTKKIRTFLFAFVLIYGFYSYFFEIIYFVDLYFPNDFLSRLLMAYEDVESVGGRNSLYRDGLTEFIDHPFIGNAITLQTGNASGYYPHNLIIEALMSTGIFGGFIFIFWVIESLYCSIKLIFLNNETTWIGLLLIQFLLFGMFSGNLYSSDIFWFLSVLVVLVYRIKFIQYLIVEKDNAINNELTS